MACPKLNRKRIGGKLFKDPHWTVDKSFWSVKYYVSGDIHILLNWCQSSVVSLVTVKPVTRTVGSR